MKYLLISLCLFSSAAIADPKLLWSLEGFDMPESVLAVPNTNHYLVSNIQGHPAEKDGKGFLSLISNTGKWINKQWAVGLDAPKGLAISQNKVFVADLTHLKIYDLESGKFLESHTHPKAKFLNDVTSDKLGNVYVSDMLGGAIYRYTEGKLTRWLELPDIPHPNGLKVQDNQLWLASWGHGMKDDFSTDSKGGLFTIDLNTKAVHALPQAQKFANLDTVEPTSKGIITNDWITGDVYLVNDGEPKHLFNAGKSAADLGIDQERLLVPIMMEGRVDVYTLE